ncbi:MAG TPA: asparagine synthase (glutamine-hydrolyzing) [Pirellulales bacterium]|nr:asparagine synthase (glutamine-hydrolyzing) [Pirellulales bacterium]
MCGIAGLIRLSDAPVPSDAIDRMTSAVAHRGPDGSGVGFYCNSADGFVECDPLQSANWRIALGHRRLSILDLSEAGRQPMEYRGRIWIAFNGEIYNYVELRRELERLGCEFHTQTDTEVILAAYDQWGADCFERLRGMWGLVLVDGRRRQAIVSRDRLGIKPVYLARTADLIGMASEIKQFASMPGAKLAPNESVVRDYLWTGYEQPGRTFFLGITPLEEGTWQAIDLTTGKISEPQHYWHPERIEPVVSDADEAARRFREVLAYSVSIHLRSDVPVGCALSGGLDSSSIAGCVKHLANGSARPLETFSVVFPGCAVNEQSYAREVVEFCHCAPHFSTPTAEEFLEDLDRFTWIHDEPVGSLAQYACYALARLTRSCEVPVTLNGQGGDEILAGYWQSYFMHLRGLFRGGRLFRLGWSFARSVLPGGNPELIKQVPVMLGRYRARRAAAAELERGRSDDDRDSSVGTRLDELFAMSEQERRVHEIRRMYLPRLLKWDDRNFMAFSVEGRYPFLDHELIELALSFAPETLYSHGWIKEPLRRGLAGMLPEAILRRRTKSGFETPQSDWLRGQLRPTLEEWLNADAPIWQLTDRSRVTQLCHSFWNSPRRNDESGQTLMRLFLADRWMRVFWN